MPNVYAPELQSAISHIETMIMEFRRKNHVAPVTLLINDDDENQSWLMWAAQILEIRVEKTTKHRTKVV